MGNAEDVVRRHEKSTRQQEDTERARKLEILNKEIRKWLYLALINLRFRDYAVHPKWCAQRRWVTYGGEQRLAWTLSNSYHGAADVEHYTCILADGTLVEGSEGQAHAIEWRTFTEFEAIAAIRSLRSIAAFPKEFLEIELRNWLFQNGLIKSPNPYA